MKRYRTYAYMLRSRMSQYPELGISLVENSIGEVDEATGVTLMDSNPSIGIVPPPIPDRPLLPAVAVPNATTTTTNRYSYRQAIYNRNMLNGDADIG